MLPTTTYHEDAQGQTAAKQQAQHTTYRGIGCIALLVAIAANMTWTSQMRYTNSAMTSTIPVTATTRKINTAVDGWF